MKLQEKRDFYKSEIDNIVAQAYNNEQKQLACDILDNATENNIDALYTFITQRVKLGFTFDAAPEVNHNCVALCKRNNKLSFGTLGNKHKMIIGENYDALKNLFVTYTKNSKGLIDVIYIDPPYNTEKSKEEGNDYKDEVESKKFIYRDKFTRNGWLNMMNERLKLARKLLSDKGVIFISIDDTEQAYLKVLCDEIFGEDNFVANVVWKRKRGRDNSARWFSKSHEYLLVYAKLLDMFDTNYLELDEETKEAYKNPDNDPRGNYRMLGVWARGTQGGVEYAFTSKNGQHFAKRLWLMSKENLTKLDKEDKLLFRGDNIYRKMFLTENKGKIPETIWDNTSNAANAADEIKKIFNSIIFDTPKPVPYIIEILKVATNKNSIILDFFAGSGTTGQAVMELNEEDGGNRKCILVANNENNIGKGIMYERIFRVVNGKGTKGEKFTWTYSKDKPYLAENSWDVFEMEYNELKIDDFDKAEKLLKEAEAEFKNLNSEYEKKNLDIYSQLASLNPYKKE